MIGVLIALAAASAVPDAEIRAAFPVETVEVAKNVYSFREPAPAGIVSGTVTAVIGEKVVLLVDTGHHPVVTADILVRLKALTPLPVAYVVNTHWHDDHNAGNATVAAAYPAAKFIAHGFTAAMQKVREPYLGGPKCLEELAQLTKPARDYLAAEGGKMPPKARAGLEGMLRGADLFGAECPAQSYRGADIVIDGKKEIDLGGRTAVVEWLGAANTAGDLIVTVPDAKLAMTGDIVVHPLPFARDGHPASWASALREIAGRDLSVIVPGHGPVLKDAAYIRALADLIGGVAEAVRAAYRPGMTIEALRVALDLAPVRTRLPQDAGSLARGFDDVAPLLVERAFQAEAGEMTPESVKH